MEGSTIFASPDGLSRGWVNLSGKGVESGDHMIEPLEADLYVEQDRQFATGFSYGGARSSSVPGSRPREFRAVAMPSRAIVSGCEGR